MRSVYVCVGTVFFFQRILSGNHGRLRAHTHTHTHTHHKNNSNHVARRKAESRRLVSELDLRVCVRGLRLRGIAVGGRFVCDQRCRRTDECEAADHVRPTSARAGARRGCSPCGPTLWFTKCVNNRPLNWKLRTFDMVPIQYVS